MSHASSDVELAAYIEDVLKTSIPNCDVFRTSRRGQLATGRGWFDEIEKAIQRASGFLLLITPQSHDRWWIMFEAGAALRSKRIFVPLLVGDLHPKDVNEPLSYLTLLQASDEGDAERAISELGGVLNDSAAFVKECSRLCEIGRRAGIEAEAWSRTEFAGHVYAWDGPLSMFSEEAAVQEPAGLEDHLRMLGLACTRGFLHDPIEGANGFMPVYRIDHGRSRHKLLHPGDRQVLWVR